MICSTWRERMKAFCDLRKEMCLVFSWLISHCYCLRMWFWIVITKASTNWCRVVCLGLFRDCLGIRDKLHRSRNFVLSNSMSAHELTCALWKKKPEETSAHKRPTTQGSPTQDLHNAPPRAIRRACSQEDKAKYCAARRNPWSTEQSAACGSPACPIPINNTTSQNGLSVTEKLGKQNSGTPKRSLGGMGRSMPYVPHITHASYTARTMRKLPLQTRTDKTEKKIKNQKAPAGREVRGHWHVRGGGSMGATADQPSSTHGGTAALR